MVVKGLQPSNHLIFSIIKIMNNELYTYYPNKVNIPKPVKLPLLYNIIKGKKDKDKIYFLTLWVNSFVNDYFKYNKTEKGLNRLTIRNRIFIKLLNQYGLYDILYIFKDFDNMIWFIYDLIQEWNENKPMYKVKVNFVWNEKELMKRFNNNIKEINKYKSLVTGKNKKVNDKDIIDLIKLNNNLSVKELSVRFKVSERTINNILKRNNINKNKIHPNHLKIMNALDNFFNRNNFEIELSNKMIIDRLDLSESALKRFKRKYPEYNQKIIDYNKSYKLNKNI